MRWLVCNESPVVAALESIGEVVVLEPQTGFLPWLAESVNAIGPGDRDPVTRALEATDAPAGAETGNFRLSQLLDTHRPDVLVLTPFHQPRWGFPLGPVSKWRNMQRPQSRRVLVGIGQDPWAMEAAKHGGYRGCACTIGRLDVYVTDTVEAAQWSAKDRRSVFWRPGDSASAIVAAVAEAHSGVPYMAGRSGRPWGLG